MVNEQCKQKKPTGDIQTREDIAVVIAAFYQKVLPDEIIGFFFDFVAEIELDDHLPVIIDFWQRQVFGDKVYQGQPFKVHQALHKKAMLTEHHFHRWLYLFEQTLDELFCGVNTETMRAKAKQIAANMQHSLNQS